MKKQYLIDDMPAMWRVHTPNLLKEILNNPGTGILYRPLQIFSNLLYDVAQRANELGDDKLNALMLRLTLYEEADPTQQGYNKEKMTQTLQKVYLKKHKTKTP